MPSAKNYIFTINNPTPEDRATVMSFENADTLKAVGASYIVFQLESGEESATPHYQGYIQFMKRRTVGQACSTLGGRASVRVARGSAEENKNYCTKEDTRQEGPWEFGQATGGQGKRTDLSLFIDAVRSGNITHKQLLSEYGEVYARYPKYCNEAIRYYQKGSIPRLVPRQGWQTELTECLGREPDSRTVMWYYDETGGSGKSYYARSYSFGEDGGGIEPRGYIITGGKHQDIYYGYKKERVVFFDWARDNQSNFPYGVVENFKNGYFLNTKYETYCCVFDSPHVVVFANFYPDLLKLSADRWQIVTI